MLKTETVFGFCSELSNFIKYINASTMADSRGRSGPDLTGRHKGMNGGVEGQKTKE